MSNPQRAKVEVIGQMLGGSSDTESSDASCDGGTEPSMTVEGSHDDTLEASSGPSSAISNKNSSSVTFFDRVEAPASESDPEGVRVSETDKITIDLRPLPRHEHTTSRNSKADPCSSKALAGETGKLDEQTAMDTTFGISYRPIIRTKLPPYNLPYRPAFVDKDDFEKQMNAEFRIGEAGLPQTTSFSEIDVLKGDDNTVKNESDDFQDEALIEVLDKQPLDNVRRNHETTTCAVQFLDDSSTEEQGVNTLEPNIDRQLVFAKALKQLTDTYQGGKGFTISQECPRAPSVISTAVADAVEGAPRPGFGLALVGSALAIMGGDLRQSPITEIEEENKEEEDCQQGGAKKGAQDPDDRERQGQEDEDCTGPEREGGQRGIVEGIESDVETPRTRAVREWEAIEQLRTAENSVPTEKGVGGTLRPITIDESSRVVSTAEASRHFRSQDHSMYKAVIVPVQPRRGRLGLFRRRPILTITGGDRLRDEVFLLAQVHYTPDNVMHRRLIQTIYRRMTLEQRACPDLGSHWETIGFQGSDPRTDLNRSMGVFSLIQALYLFEAQPGFAAVLHRESTADITGWPFLCISIGFTKEAVGVLRRGACYSECNRRGSVLEVVHELHQAQFHAFLGLCRKVPATHHAVHLATVRTLMEKGSHHSLVKDYRSYLSAEKDRHLAASSVPGTGGGGQIHGKLDFGRSKEFPKQQCAVMSSRQLRYMTASESDDP